MIFQSHHNPSWLLAGFVFGVIVQKNHNCVDQCQHNCLLLFWQGIKCIIWFILLSMYLNVVVILAIIVVLFCDLFDVLIPLNGCTSNFFKITYRPVLILSNVYCHFSLLSVKWLLCIQPVNLPNVPLSRFSSSMSGWLMPCLTSISSFFWRAYFMRCGIETWLKTGPLYCLSWIKMCWWFFGGLLGCCLKCCPYSMTCVGQASLVHNHNQQDILVCNSYPWKPRYDVHCLWRRPFHHCHLSYRSLIS